MPPSMPSPKVTQLPQIVAPDATVSDKPSGPLTPPMIDAQTESAPTQAELALAERRARNKSQQRANNPKSPKAKQNRTSRRRQIDLVPHSPREQAPGIASAAAPAAPLPQSDPATTFVAGPVSVPTGSQQRLFSRITVLSFVLCVLLPVLASAAYYLFAAVDRYAVEIKFAIRSPSGASSTDLMGLVSGSAAAGSTIADSWMVVEYLESREFLDKLSQQIDLKALYSEPLGDPLTRLPVDATTEDMVDFLPRIISANFESATQIITVETQAFTPSDASRMAEVVLEASSTLINSVSEKARQDTVRLAELELARAEEALREQRAAIASFRETEQKIDPTASVATQEGVLAQLQNRLASTRTELSSLREFLSPEAPSVRVLQSQIDSLERQIGAERARLGIGEIGAPRTGEMSRVAESLNRSVTLYEALKVDLDFRERAYLSALSSLEAARIEADRQQRYVATFVAPSQPQSARYPQVTLSMILIGAVAFLIWGVLAMFLHILREHLT